MNRNERLVVSIMLGIALFVAVWAHGRVSVQRRDIYFDREWWAAKIQLDWTQSDILEDHMARLSRLEREIAELQERNPVGRIDTTHIQQSPFTLPREWCPIETLKTPRIFYPGYRMRGDSLVYDTLEAYRVIPRALTIPNQTRGRLEI